MRKVLSVVLFGLGASTLMFGQPVSPEIDPGSGACALALLAGAVLLVRHKIKR